MLRCVFPAKIACLVDDIGMVSALLCFRCKVCLFLLVIKSVVAIAEIFDSPLNILIPFPIDGVAALVDLLHPARAVDGIIGESIRIRIQNTLIHDDLLARLGIRRADHCSLMRSSGTVFFRKTETEFCFI